MPVYGRHKKKLFIWKKHFPQFSNYWRDIRFITTHTHTHTHKVNVCLYIHIRSDMPRTLYGHTHTHTHTHTYIYIYIYICWYDKNKWKSGWLKHVQRVSSSLNKERNIATKPVVSIGFIHFSTYFYHFVRFTKIYPSPAIDICRRSWCNGYRDRKWKWRPEIKSRTRLFAFHIALIPFEKIWIKSFLLQLWINSRVAGIFNLAMATGLGERRV